MFSIQLEKRIHVHHIQNYYKILINNYERWMILNIYGKFHCWGGYYVISNLEACKRGYGIKVPEGTR